MPLSPGTKLGQYEVVEGIGAGGMGEVYRARDTKLGREVAIKVLPDDLRQDPERLMRFEREARVLASLNHPNIATLYGLEKEADITFLAMELVPGETLGERLASGRMSHEEVVILFQQIAEAVEAAHARGVVHRDLKPPNIKLTPEGRIKVLDFGLAKALAAEEPASDLSHSPTLTRDATRAGVILGTVSYMSPEQAKGKSVDKRADIWAFGCVLFEALAGRKAFDGESVTDVLANVIHKDPPWDALPPDTPWRTREVLRRCLTKDPHLRLHDIADARIELGTPSDGLELAGAASSTSFRRQVLVAGLALALALALGAGVATIFRGAAVDTPGEPQRFVILPPRQEPPLELSNPIVSPDGRRVVYRGVGPTGLGNRRGETLLYLRELSDQESRALPGTAGAVAPFFSPDGLWVGFFSGAKLRKISVRGGTPIEVCDASSELPGGQWASDGSIWFTPSWSSGFVKVSADGGALTEVTTPDASRGEVAHWWPDFLPDGKTVLFTIATNEGFDRFRIGALDIGTGTWRDLFAGVSARYVPSGHILYYQSGIYQIAPFDLSRLERTGPAVPALESTKSLEPTGGTRQFYAFSSTGVLVTVPGAASRRTSSLFWIDRVGRLEPLPFESAPYGEAEISPDGRRLAVSRIDEGLWKIWLYDLDLAAFEKLTTESNSFDPRWTPDGERLIYTTGRRGKFDVLSKPVDVFGTEEVILEEEADRAANALSPDGKWLAVLVWPVDMGADLALLELGAGSELTTVVASPFIDDQASFSRDSAWLAYTSNASGRGEVYVQEIRGDGATVKISADGGNLSVWSPIGDELYFQRENTIMAVSYEVEGGALRSGVPRPIAEMPEGSVLGDISPDGERFLIISPTGEDPPPTELHVTLHWFEELERLVPTEN